MMTSSVFHKVVDALDIETYLLAETQEEGRNLGLKLMADLGFLDVDIVFVEFDGQGVRLRLRATIHKVGLSYPWLMDPEKRDDLHA